MTNSVHHHCFYYCQACRQTSVQICCIIPWHAVIRNSFLGLSVQIKYLCKFCLNIFLEVNLQITLLFWVITKIENTCFLLQGRFLRVENLLCDPMQNVRNATLSELNGITFCANSAIQHAITSYMYQLNINLSLAGCPILEVYSSFTNHNLTHMINMFPVLINV